MFIHFKVWTWKHRQIVAAGLRPSTSSPEHWPQCPSFAIGQHSSFVSTPVSPAIKRVPWTSLWQKWEISHQFIARFLNNLLRLITSQFSHLNSMRARIVHRHFCALDSDGTLGGNLTGQREGGLTAIRWRTQHPGDQAWRQMSVFWLAKRNKCHTKFLCFHRRNIAPGEGQLPGPAVVAGDQVDPLQNAHIRSESNVHFLRGKLK